MLVCRFTGEDGAGLPVSCLAGLVHEYAQAAYNRIIRRPQVLDAPDQACSAR
jgi:hypothetical protein